jgi:hypothetical protein
VSPVNVLSDETVSPCPIGRPIQLVEPRRVASRSTHGRRTSSSPTDVADAAFAIESVRRVSNEEHCRPRLFRRAASEAAVGRYRGEAFPRVRLDGGRNRRTRSSRGGRRPSSRSCRRRWAAREALVGSELGSDGERHRDNRSAREAPNHSARHAHVCGHYVKYTRLSAVTSRGGSSSPVHVVVVGVVGVLFRFVGGIKAS